MSRTLVIWSKEEKQLIARNLLNLLSAESKGTGVAALRLHVLSALGKRGFFSRTLPKVILASLPVHRTRTIHQEKQVMWLRPMLEEILAARDLAAKVRAADFGDDGDEDSGSEVDYDATGVAVEDETHGPFVNNQEPEDLIEITSGLFLKKQGLEALAKELAPLLVKEIAALLPQHSGSFSTSIFAKMAGKHNPEPVSKISSEPKKIKVLIYGPLPVQAHEIEKQFHDKLKLVFLENEVSAKRIKAQIGCRYAIGMTSKISHSAHDALATFGANHFMAMGGKASICHALHTILTREGRNGN